MTRVRLSKEGLEIAKEGFDVDSATPEQLIFSSNLPTMRLALTGVVTLVRYSGPGSDRFARAIVNYEKPFPRSPLVLAAGIISSTRSDQAPFNQQAALSYAMWARYSIASYTNRFEIYGYDRDTVGNPVDRPTRTYRYFVFHNTVDYS